jgi:hypothetical protein
MIGLLMENGEMGAFAALDRFDIARLNELMALFTRFIECVEGNLISYSDRFPMLQK